MTLVPIIPLLTILLLTLIQPISATHQGITASGAFTCNGEPLIGATVKFIEHDRFFLDPDEIVAVTKTNQDGMFYVTGRTYEFTQIEPEVHVFYRCDSAECKHVSWKVDPAHIETEDEEKPIDYGKQEVNALKDVERHDRC